IMCAWLAIRTFSSVIGTYHQEPEQRAFNELSRRTALANNRLVSIVIRDSVMRVLPGNPTLFMKTFMDVPNDELARVGDLATKEAATQRPVAAAGAAIAPFGLGSHPALRDANIGRVDNLIVVRSAPAACTHVIGLPTNPGARAKMLQWTYPGRQILGPCRF